MNIKNLSIHWHCYNTLYLLQCLLINGSHRTSSWIIKSATAGTKQRWLTTLHQAYCNHFTDSIEHGVATACTLCSGTICCGQPANRLDNIKASFISGWRNSWCSPPSSVDGSSMKSTFSFFNTLKVGFEKAHMASRQVNFWRCEFVGSFHWLV